MATKNSCIPLSAFCGLLMVIPFFCLAFMPLIWCYWVYGTCILFIVSAIYCLEREKKPLEIGITFSFAFVGLCIVSTLWAVACFLAWGGETSIADTWQTIGSLTAAGLTGTAAFATLGTLLHLIKEKREEEPLKNFEIYRKHKEEFESFTKRLERRLSSKYELLPNFVIRDPEDLYHKIFKDNTCFSLKIECSDLCEADFLPLVSRKLFEIHTGIKKWYAKPCLSIYDYYQDGIFLPLNEMNDCFNMLNIQPETSDEPMGTVVEMHNSERQGQTMLNIFTLYYAIELLFEVLNEYQSFCQLPKTEGPSFADLRIYCCPSIITACYSGVDEITISPERLIGPNESYLYVGTYEGVVELNKLNEFIVIWRRAVHFSEGLSFDEKEMLLSPLRYFEIDGPYVEIKTSYMKDVLHSIESRIQKIPERKRGDLCCQLECISKNFQIGMVA